jgi:hypothetical protein
MSPPPYDSAMPKGFAEGEATADSPAFGGKTYQLKRG